MVEVTNEELKVLLEKVHEDLLENTKINKQLIELMLKNNKQTQAVYDYVEVQLSPEQEFRDFLINTGANLVGNAIATPTIIDTRPLFNRR